MTEHPAARAVAFLRERGRRSVGLVGDRGAGASSDLAAHAAATGADGVFDPERFDGSEPPSFDALVVAEAFGPAMRRLAPVMAHDVVVLPADPDWAAPAAVRQADEPTAAWATTAETNYVARSALKGHYVEFGTFWGRAFFPAYFTLRHFLAGRFFAFDSFAGLSAPSEAESALTGGDFQEGAYACNQGSFETLAAYLGMPEERLVVAPGFYDDSLARGSDAYGLAPRSVSVCAIDCDLYGPTAQALAFVTPLLEDGALVYFDDWRLCRASPHVGERAAALDWLAAHPEIELIDLPTDRSVPGSWQHQWFIVQRR